MSIKGADGDPAGNIDLGRQKLFFYVRRPPIKLFHGARASQSAGTPFPIYPQNVSAPKFPLPLQSVANAQPNPNGSTSFTAYVRLPAPLDAISGDVKLTTTNSGGLQLDYFYVHGENIPIFSVNVREIGALYERANSAFDGFVKTGLPFANSLQVDGDIHFLKSRLTRLYVAVDNLNVPIYSAIYLQRIGGGFETQPSFRILGDTRFTAGPTLVNGGAAAEVAGAFSWTFNNDNSWVLGADNVGLKVAGISLANANAHLYSSGGLDFAGHFGYDWGPFSLNANLGGGFGNNAFFVEGAGKGCASFPVFGRKCIGVRAIVSNIGVSGCGKVDYFLGTAEVGASYRWGGSFRIFTGCDLGRFRPVIASARSSSTERIIPVRGGQEAVALELKGTTGPPRVKLTAPDGTQVTTPADPRASIRTDRFWVIQDPAQKTTSVLVGRPAAGTWRASTVPGSPQIAGVSTAEPLPKPRIKARITGVGRKRRLHYSVRPIRGQQIDFVETGPSGVKRRVARVGGRSKGSVRFTVAAGRGGRRRIVALVNQDGLPRKSLTAATFRAPKPARPGRPRRVRVQRKGTTLRISWRRGKGARSARYDVRLRFVSGRRLRFVTTHRSLRLGQVGWPDRATVTIRGLTRSGLTGPAAKAKLRRGKPPRAVGRVRRWRSRRR